MRQRRCLVLMIFFFLIPMVAQADLSVRECIKGPSSGRWELPGDSVWRTVLTLQFSNVLSSDVIAQAAITYHEGPGQTGVKVEYQLVLDSVSSFTMQHRPQTGFPTAKMLRASFPDVAAGPHTLELRARSTSSFSAYFAQAWLAPVLVESTEAGSSGVASASLTTPSTNTWTTLVTTTVSPPSGRAVVLGAYSAATAGPLNQLIEYRILRGSTVIGTFFDSVGSYLPSGQSFAMMDRTPGSSSVTYSLQARTTGGATTFSTRRLLTQTIPGDLTVYEGSVTNVSIPADMAWHPLVSSSSVVLSPASVGPYGTRGFGFASVTYNGAYNNEALLRFNFLADKAWEVGVRPVHGTGSKTVLEGLISDWERLGFSAGNSYSMQLNAVGQCSSGSNLSVRSARFQIVVLPDNDGFVTPVVCAAHPGTCCSDFPSTCSAYTCTAGSLATVSGPGTDCPVPP
ncbi:MAG TPA: hypothetical protein VH394_29700 [Thermoanaerobaculia bacterium]|nr:hypothetical protein [Thermoanaerobaculia bacterium]